MTYLAKCPRTSQFILNKKFPTVKERDQFQAELDLRHERELKKQKALKWARKGAEQKRQNIKKARTPRHLR